jgi:hypothetical protein
MFLFKCYWYDTTNREIKIDPHYGLVEINTKARLLNIDDVFVFAKQCQKIYYTYTSSFRNDRSRFNSSMLTMPLFSPSNAIKFITHTLLSLEKIVQELIDYP